MCCPHLTHSFTVNSQNVIWTRIIPEEIKGISLVLITFTVRKKKLIIVRVKRERQSKQTIRQLRQDRESIREAYSLLDFCQDFLFVTALSHSRPKINEY